GEIRTGGRRALVRIFEGARAPRSPARDLADPADRPHARSRRCRGPRREPLAARSGRRVFLLGRDGRGGAALHTRLAALSMDDGQAPRQAARESAAAAGAQGQARGRDRDLLLARRDRVRAPRRGCAGALARGARAGAASARLSRAAPHGATGSASRTRSTIGAGYTPSQITTIAAPASTSRPAAETCGASAAAAPGTGSRYSVTSTRR